MKNEIWRDIPSLPEYEASSLGRVRRRIYQAKMPNGGIRWYGGVPHYGQSHESDPRPNFVFRGKTYRISVLICEAFHGLKPFPKAVAMHIDDNETNNSEDNLKWGTQKENLNTPKFLAYCAGRTGDDSPGRKGRRL
jgi:hypothetical protein